MRALQVCFSMTLLVLTTACLTLDYIDSYDAGLGGNGGSSGACMSSSAGQSSSSAQTSSSGAACPEFCRLARGYHCEDGECVLNGGSGPVQVTLNWTSQPRAREDLDLHVIDPNGCEIYYGNRRCGTGSLDLDQNAACANTDNQCGVGDDTENVIYTSGQEPPTGVYTVWVVNWEDQCDGPVPAIIHYTVTVRFRGQVQTFTGQFAQGTSVEGGAVQGLQPAEGRVLVTQFAY